MLCKSGIFILIQISQQLPQHLEVNFTPTNERAFFKVLHYLLMPALLFGLFSSPSESFLKLFEAMF